MKLINQGETIYYFFEIFVYQGKQFSWNLYMKGKYIFF